MLHVLRVNGGKLCIQIEYHTGRALVLCIETVTSGSAGGYESIYALAVTHNIGLLLKRVNIRSSATVCSSLDPGLCSQSFLALP